MTRMARIAAIGVAMAFPFLANAKIARSSSAKAEFKRQQPCPSTGQPRGTCPGHIVDHIVPLYAGGPDEPGNMQWQTIDDGKRKDREKLRMCQINQTNKPAREAVK